MENETPVKKFPNVKSLQKEVDELKETNNKILDIVSRLAENKTEDKTELAKEEKKEDDDKFLGQKITRNVPEYDRILKEELGENFKLITTLQPGISTVMTANIIPPEEFKENKDDVRSKVIGSAEPDAIFKEFCIMVRKNIISRLDKEGRNIPAFMKRPEDTQNPNDAFAFDRRI